MLLEASDFLADVEVLADLLVSLSDSDWQRNTTFKSWTINQVLQHLHGTDHVADLALSDPEAFKAMASSSSESRKALNPTLEGRELLAAWREKAASLAAQMGELDGSARVPWFGPDMGVRMFATARQMETWAHGQAVFDLMGVGRLEADRVKNIAVIGVKTYGWTFANRQMSPPGPAPYVELTAPSGEVWSFNDFSEDDFVEGSAVDFCHVVTQVRNIADVDLTVWGEVSEAWMSIAQCFAGKPEDPPAPGSRLHRG